MYDTVGVTVFQCAAYLSRELSRTPFPQAAMRDDVVKQLPTIHIFEDHVIVMWVNKHAFHTCNVRVMQQENNGRFSNGSDFFR